MIIDFQNKLFLKTRQFLNYFRNDCFFIKTSVIVDLTGLKHDIPRVPKVGSIVLAARIAMEQVSSSVAYDVCLHPLI